ncbi:MAG: hypothetical protein M3N17_03720 [Actinomycetota bacterium]|nr:hypothetical protein [Actinomycetota bacterium]
MIELLFIAVAAAVVSRLARQSVTDAPHDRGVTVDERVWADLRSRLEGVDRGRAA